MEEASSKNYKSEGRAREGCAHERKGKNRTAYVSPLWSVTKMNVPIRGVW